MNKNATKSKIPTTSPKVDIIAAVVFAPFAFPFEYAGASTKQIIESTANAIPTAIRTVGISI